MGFTATGPAASLGQASLRFSEASPHSLESVTGLEAAAHPAARSVTLALAKPILGVSLASRLHHPAFMSHRRATSALRYLLAVRRRREMTRTESLLLQTCCDCCVCHKATLSTRPDHPKFMTTGKVMSLLTCFHLVVPDSKHGCQASCHRGPDLAERFHRHEIVLS